ncbi:19333_t:CDS:2 [Dentiscutata erythropus]|uniref:19333_t:CDS:1 n=1 Tax=Dentiscutata erythropus TaxID=1348616 RepID=A0A9N9G5P5_9GLOM|nr:19333_t:CDS:2 [Dentiscutata erythropus]
MFLSAPLKFWPLLQGTVQRGIHMSEKCGQPTTPIRKRTPHTRLSTPTQSRLTTPTTARTNKSSKSVASSPSSPISPLQNSTLLRRFKSCKKKTPRSSPKKEALRLDVIAGDWISVCNTPSKVKKVRPQCDRFIPTRDIMGDLSNHFNTTHRESGKEQYMDSADLEYQEKLAEACGIAFERRILQFSAPPNGKDELSQTYSQRSKKFTTSIQLKRRIATVPERILDAPGMIDDYYLNLLDWNVKNMLAIGLDQNVYVWNADTGDVRTIAQTEANDYISSLSWSHDGEYLAVGTSDGDTQIWDILREQKVRSMSGHTARVGVLTWNKYLVSSGCKDGSIWHHDTRVAQHKIAELLDHASEVCGLKWSYDGEQLASGGNDNRVNIWDARSSIPKITKNNHLAAVKAVAWCPWKNNLLATGGGSFDRQIHFWNTSSASRLKSIDTGSQVTSIIWSKEYQELLSTHGFPEHHMSIWSYPKCRKIIDIQAHDTRVLHSAISPDGQVVATAASDENLKFWRVFQSQSKNERSRSSVKDNETSVYSGLLIR